MPAFEEAFPALDGFHGEEEVEHVEDLPPSPGDHSGAEGDELGVEEEGEGSEGERQAWAGLEGNDDAAAILALLEQSLDEHEPLVHIDLDECFAGRIPCCCFFWTA